jgi:hypothetical protein
MQMQLNCTKKVETISVCVQVQPLQVDISAGFVLANKRGRDVSVLLACETAGVLLAD